MENLSDPVSIIKKIIFDNPLAFICAILMIIYIIKGKTWHAMYTYALLCGVYVVSRTVGVSEFIGGVIVGVAANEIFAAIRKRLEAENQRAKAKKELKE